MSSLFDRYTKARAFRNYLHRRRRGGGEVRCRREEEVRLSTQRGSPQIGRHRDEFTAPPTWILVKHETRDEIRELSTILNHERGACEQRLRGCLSAIEIETDSSEEIKILVYIYIYFILYILLFLFYFNILLIFVEIS